MAKKTQTSTHSPIPLVAPMLNERQDRYFERADKALRRKIVDRNSRTSQILRDWSRSGVEDELQACATQALAAVAECDPSEVAQHFEIRRNRPIFPEHEVTNHATGKREKYDRAALGAIVDRCNRRILETGDLAALSAGHTPDQKQQASGMPMPPMVGLAGPFRLGLIGAEDKPKWCIFADEAIFKDDWPDVRKMPRRSPEVWLEPNMSDRAMDPIAVLGSETPRLDTGVARFSRRLDPARFRNVARYSMGAASFPSGSDTFVKDDKSTKPTEKYSAVNEGTMDDESIQAVVKAVLDAISATPQWAYLTDQMQTASNPVPEEADNGPESDEPTETVVDPSNPVGQPADQGAVPATGEQAGPPPAPKTEAEPQKNAMPTGDKAPASDGQQKPANAVPEGGETLAKTDVDKDSAGDTAATPEELAAMGDEERNEYGQLSGDGQNGYMVARRRHCKAGSMQYASTTERARYSRLESEAERLRGEVTALRADRTCRERYSQLAELSHTFDFDPAEEIEDCKNLTDTEFEKHLKRIEKYSRRDPNGGMPTLHLEPLERDESVDELKKEKYSRRAVKIATDKGISFAEALEFAKAEDSKQ